MPLKDELKKLVKLFEEHEVLHGEHVTAGIEGWQKEIEESKKLVQSHQASRSEDDIATVQTFTKKIEVLEAKIKSFPEDSAKREAALESQLSEMQSAFNALWETTKSNGDNSDIATLLKFGLFTGLIKKEVAQKEAASLIEKGIPFSESLNLAIIAGQVNRNNFPPAFAYQINQKDELGLTPIFYAATLGDNGADMIKFLGENGAIAYRFKFPQELQSSTGSRTRDYGLDSVYLRNSQIVIQKAQELGGLTAFSTFNKGLMDALEAEQKNIVTLISYMDSYDSVTAQLYSPGDQVIRTIKDDKIGPKTRAIIPALEAIVLRYLNEESSKTHSDLEAEIVRKAVVAVATYYLLRGDLGALRDIFELGLHLNETEANQFNTTIDKAIAAGIVKKSQIEQIFAQTGNQVFDLLKSSMDESVIMPLRGDESFLQIYSSRIEAMADFFDSVILATKKIDPLVREEFIGQAKVIAATLSANEVFGVKGEINQENIVAKAVLSAMLKNPNLSKEDSSKLRDSIDKLNRGEKIDLTSLKKSSEYKLLSSLLTLTVKKIAENEVRSTSASTKKGIIPALFGWMGGGKSKSEEKRYSVVKDRGDQIHDKHVSAATLFRQERHPLGSSVDPKKFTQERHNSGNQIDQGVEQADLSKKIVDTEAQIVPAVKQEVRAETEVPKEAVAPSEEQLKIEKLAKITGVDLKKAKEDFSRS